jgi:hypothetical protein
MFLFDRRTRSAKQKSIKVYACPLRIFVYYNKEVRHGANDRILWVGMY